MWIRIARTSAGFASVYATVRYSCALPALASRSSSCSSSGDGEPGYSAGWRSSYRRRLIFVSARASSCTWSPSAYFRSQLGSSGIHPFVKCTSSRRT